MPSSPHASSALDSILWRKAQLRAIECSPPWRHDTSVLSGGELSPEQSVEVRLRGATCMGSMEIWTQCYLEMFLDRMSPGVGYSWVRMQEEAYG